MFDAWRKGLFCFVMKRESVRPRAVKFLCVNKGGGQIIYSASGSLMTINRLFDSNE